MDCPECRCARTAVESTLKLGHVVTRLRRCPDCECSWQTEEVIRHIRKPAPGTTGDQGAGRAGTEPASSSPSDLTLDLTSGKKRKPETETEVCSEPAEPILIWFPVVGGGKGKKWGLVASALASYRSAFPHLDVEAEFRQAALWCEANAPRRKTADGMPRFLMNWLKKAQNDSRTQRIGAPPNAQGAPRTGVLSPLCSFHRLPANARRRAPKHEWREVCPECRHVGFLTAPRPAGEPATIGDLLNGGSKP